MSVGRLGFSDTVAPGTPAFDDLVQRVIYQESRGNPNAVSPAGAAGLMQVMPGTARQPGYGVRPMPWDKRFDPQENVRMGRDYLGAMLNEFDGNVARALVAYNAGPGTAGKWDGRPGSLPGETRGYLGNIMQDASYAKPQYGPEAYKRVSGSMAGQGMPVANIGSQAGKAAMDTMQASIGGQKTADPGDNHWMGAQPANATPGAQTPGGVTDMMNLQLMASQPAGFSSPTQQHQLPQTRIHTPRVQSGSRGPVRQTPQMPTATFVS